MIVKIYYYKNRGKEGKVYLNLLFLRLDLNLIYGSQGSIDM